MAYKFAYFAGGCFWCMVNPFDVFKGVEWVKSGYMGGHEKTAQYQTVKRQTSGHYEVIEIKYDDAILSYETLLQAFWRQIDPTDGHGQFQDRGPSYRTAIFYTSQDQRVMALESIADLEASKRFEGDIVTPILKAMTFYTAEDYHQDYYKKDPDAYYLDRSKSGRDEFIKKYWGDDYFTIYEDIMD